MEGIIIFYFILRIVGAFVCANKASETNRNNIGWGFFGFFMPIIAMIIAMTLKPKTDWHRMDENQN